MTLSTPGVFAQKIISQDFWINRGIDEDAMARAVAFVGIVVALFGATFFVLWAAA